MKTCAHLSGFISNDYSVQSSRKALMEFQQSPLSAEMIPNASDCHGKEKDQRLTSYLNYRLIVSPQARETVKFNTRFHKISLFSLQRFGHRRAIDGGGTAGRRVLGLTRSPAKLPPER